MQDKMELKPRDRRKAGPFVFGLWAAVYGWKYGNCECTQLEIHLSMYKSHKTIVNKLLNFG